MLLSPIKFNEYCFLKKFGVIYVALAQIFNCFIMYNQNKISCFNNS